MSGSAAANGSPPTAGVGCSIPASSTALTGRASWARIGVARCWMLAIARDDGLLGRRHPHAHRAQRADDAPGDDRLLLAVLVGAQQLLAEVVVDGGVGAAPRRAGQRERPGAQAVAADEQLGAGGDERALPAPGAEGEARREGLAQDAEHRRRVVRARRVDLHLAREDDLVQRSGADALDGSRDRGLVVLGRHRADHAIAPGRGGVEQRQRRAAQRLGALEQPARRARRDRRRERRRRPASASPRSPRRAQRHLGHVQRGGLEARPVRRRAAVGREGEASDGHRRRRPRRRRVGHAAPASARRRARSARRRGRRARPRDRPWPARNGRDRGARSRTSPRPGGARRPPPRWGPRRARAPP